jgi:hypothetical protein
LPWCHPSTSEESTLLSRPGSEDAVPVKRWSSSPWARMDSDKHDAKGKGKNSSTTASTCIYTRTALPPAEPQHLGPKLSKENNNEGA